VGGEAALARTSAAVAFATAFVMQCAACGNETNPPPSKAIVLDEGRGSYDGVAIGQRESAARRARGRPDRAGPDECDLCPAGVADAELGQPTWIDAGGAGDHTLRYRDLVVLVAGDRVDGILVTGRRARTRRGVRIGDRLARAADRYPELECGTANLGSEYVPHRYCAGRLGRLFVSFGADPIRSITVSRARLSG
jgi:hypothetical protein